MRHSRGADHKVRSLELHTRTMSMVRSAIIPSQPRRCSSSGLLPQTSNEAVNPSSTSNAPCNQSLESGVEQVPTNPTQFSRKTSIVSSKDSDLSSAGLEKNDCIADAKEVENTKMDKDNGQDGYPVNKETEADVSKVQVDVVEKSIGSNHERNSQSGNFEGGKHFKQAESKHKLSAMLANDIQKSEKCGIALKLTGEIDSHESKSTALKTIPTPLLERSKQSAINSSSALLPESLPEKCDHCDARDKVREDGKALST